MDRLDELDIRILKILQADAKKTTKEIAAQLNLTVSPVYDRIRRLEKDGYIKKYVAILDAKRLNLPVTAMCQITLKAHYDKYIEDFEEAVKKVEEVQECYHMAGQVDYLLKINVPGLEEYHDFVRNKLSKIPNIGTLNTAFVIKEVFHTSGYFI